MINLNELWNRTTLIDMMHRDDMTYGHINRINKFKGHFSRENYDIGIGE